jgi:CHAT domain-containing protein/tetratricopeptide (TPR) repeat protein
MRALLCGLLLAGMACGAAPPARLTPEQVKLLRQRPWFVTNEKTLDIELRVYGPWHRQVEKTAESISNAHQARGEWAQEAKYRRVVLVARQALLGEGHWQTVDARLALAEALTQTRRTPQQREALKQAIRLNGQARALYGQGKTAKGIPPAKKALLIVKEVLGERHPAYAQHLHNLGVLYESMGDYRAALPLHQKALEVRKEVLGEKHPSSIDSVHNLASLYFSMGEYRTAIPLFRKALRMTRAVWGERHPDYATSLNNLAFLCQSMGDHKAALPLYQKALKITRETLGELHPHSAQSLNNLATLYKDMGDYRAALPLFQEALEIIKQARGEASPDHATYLNNLALLYVAMGDHKQALPLLRKALRITREMQGEKHPDYATCLINLAVLYKKMRDYKKALPLYKQALLITEEALGEKHPFYASRLNNLAILYQAMGEHIQALRVSQKALRLSQEVLGEKHPHYAICLSNLATLYQRMGEHKQALALLQKAFLIRKEVLGEGHPDYATCLHNLAAVYQSMGDEKGALPRAEEGFARALAYLRTNAFIQSDRQQLAAADAMRYRLELRLSLMDAACYGHVLTWKGAVLLRQRHRRLFTAFSADPKTRQAAEELQSVTRQIAMLSASNRPVREQLQRLTEEQERLQAKLSKVSAEDGAAFKVAALTPHALSEALPEGAVLVDYLFYWRSGLTYRDGRPNGLWHLVAFVSRKGKPTTRIDLGPATKTVEAVRKWRRLLLDGKAGQPLGAELKELIWSPLEKHLVGAKVVLVSPDEALASVPFAALPGKKEGTYLIEDVALAVVPVPALLPEMLKPVDRAKRLKPSLLVVGDVDYDRTGPIARADKAGDRGAPLGVRRDWGKLSATAVEGLAVRASFEKLFKTGKATALTEGEATKAKVRQALEKVRYAHLATHGFFATEDVKSALGGKTKADAFFGREGVTGWHPLLLSGVVLAGANKEPKEGEEDGILTALEVSEMELPWLELVVLSACETGLGRHVAGGEGLLGLQRAFAVAGARAVVASLWSVDDKATQALMAEFYRVAWAEKAVVSKAEALRRAQLALMWGTVVEGKFRGIGKVPEKLPSGTKEETRLPPLYWAAFVLSGDWR